MADVAFFEGRQSTPVPPAHAIPSPSPLQMLSTSMECNPVGSGGGDADRAGPAGWRLRSRHSHLLGAVSERRAGHGAVGEAARADDQGPRNHDTRSRDLTRFKQEK